MRDNSQALATPSTTPIIPGQLSAFASTFYDVTNLSPDYAHLNECILLVEHLSLGRTMKIKTHFRVFLVQFRHLSPVGLF